MASMLAMGIATILYEKERNHPFSTAIICSLLGCIFGLLYIDESCIWHYWFAGGAFLMILIFMIINHAQTAILVSLACIYYIAHYWETNIFWGEIVYIGNFAVYYLYLHCVGNPPV